MGRKNVALLKKYLERRTIKTMHKKTGITRKTGIAVAVAGLLTSTITLTNTSAAIGVSKDGKQTTAKNTTVRVASYNLCKKTCAKGANSWKNRLPKLVRNIQSSNADVVGIQEGADRAVIELVKKLPSNWALAGTHAGLGGCGYGCTQDSYIIYDKNTISEPYLAIPNTPEPAICIPHEDAAPYPVAQPVRPTYPTLEPEPTPPTLSRTDKNYEKAWADYKQAKYEWDIKKRQYDQDVANWSDTLATWQKANTAWKEANKAWNVEYRENDCDLYEDWPTVVNGNAGFAALSKISSFFKGAQFDRMIGWAVLTNNANQTNFLVASAHLPPEKTSTAEKTRKATAKAITAHLEQIKASFNSPTMPSIITGDLNSFHDRQPKGAQWIIERAGYKDPFDNKRERGQNWKANTINVTGIRRNPWVGPPIIAKDGTPARIDYVLGKNTVGSNYTVWIKKNGKNFDRRYRGSDHNLIFADWQLAGSALSSEILYENGKPWTAKTL